MVERASPWKEMRAPTPTLGGAYRFWPLRASPEAVLWRALRDGRLGGHEFRRREPFGPYSFGFYCARAKLAVEIDGQDARRDAWLAELGVRVLRFSAAEILDEARRPGVLAAIAAAAAGPLAA